MKLLWVALFVGIVSAWAMLRLTGDGAAPVRARQVNAAPLPPVALPSATPPATVPGATPTAASAAAVASVEPGSPEPTPPAPSPAPVATATPSPVPVTRPPAVVPAAASPAAPPPRASTPAAAGQDAVRDAVLTGQLDARIRAMTHALISADPGALRPLLAARCAGMDVETYVSTRRDLLAGEVGAPLDRLRVAPPFIGHIDVGVGEAHVLLAFEGGRARYALALDWWLLEREEWRVVAC